jgi:superfamily II DNA/RNA helicase
LTDTDPAQAEQDEILSGPKQSAAGDDPGVAPGSASVVAATGHAADADVAEIESAVTPGVVTGADVSAPAADEPDGPDEYEYDDEEHGAAYAAHLAAPEEPARALFADLGLSDEVLRAIDDMGYRHPTPIQEQAIPVILMTRDVLGVAQTGTGKTAGFTLPMLDILAGSRARARMPRSLILEPTRELALQVAENFVQYGKYLKLTHALIIGGESMSDQREVLNRGVDVLIATPGRLIDMFERGTILLTDTRILVIDEADRMLDMGFIPDVERIVALLPKTRQTLFFSATMGPEIKRLADAFLQNPKEITVSRSATVAVGITEGLALVAEHDKREALRRLIRTQNVQNALIFCNRKSEVDILHKSLVRHKFDAGALHGDMAQTVRFTTLEKFKAGELRLLVCSDVAARGLDIGGLSHVFNFDVPHHAEDYVHRIGRTGRAGLEGHAFTIAMPEDRLAVEAIEKLTGHPIPPMIVEGLDPVDWAEFDGRKRRGGRKAPAGKKAPAAKTARGKRGEEHAPRGRDQAAPARTRETGEAPVPAKEHAEVISPRSREEAAFLLSPGLETSPAESEVERPVRARERAAHPRARDAAPRMRPPREEPRREEPRREAPRGEAPRAEASGSRDRPPMREERPAEHRRERWRQEDLGPAVVGFGDDIPAFMMVRRRPAPAPVPETDA